MELQQNPVRLAYSNGPDHCDEADHQNDGKKNEVLNTGSFAKSILNNQSNIEIQSCLSDLLQDCSHHQRSKELFGVPAEAILTQSSSQVISKKFASCLVLILRNASNKELSEAFST
jgi:hypothetical protein